MKGSILYPYRVYGALYGFPLAGAPDEVWEEWFAKAFDWIHDPQRSTVKPQEERDTN